MTEFSRRETEEKEVGKECTVMRRARDGRGKRGTKENVINLVLKHCQINY